MTVTVYGPVLTKDNYDAFRRFVRDAPATFPEWVHRRDQKAADAIGKRWEFVEVEIDLENYIRDCDATQTPYDLHSLNNFAAKVALRERK
jgi:hypothetical protein